MQRYWPWALALTLYLASAQPLAAQRDLAPGVLKVIPPRIDIRDTYSLPMPLNGVQATPFDGNFIAQKETLHGQSRAVVFFRDVWQYEFAFMGLRQAKLQVTQPDGSTRLKNFWYMVYRLRDTGASLTYEQVKEDPRFEHMRYELRPRNDIQPKEHEFVLRFSLEGWVKDDNGDYRRVVYRDQIRPSILKQIQFLEDPDLPLLDTIQMMNSEIPLAQNPSDPGLWGVAIWGEVDPRIDFVSVFASGFTNAYRLQRQPDGSVAVKKKNLQLNFWRPGDIVAEDQDQVDFGIPLVDDPARQIEITKRYELPGPLIRGYLDSAEANQPVLMVEVDAEVNLKDFTSALTPKLDQGRLPEKIVEAFADAGVDISADTTVNVDIPGSKWTFSIKTPDRTESYILKLEPQFWERDFEGIRFIKSLDYLWVYR